MLAIHPVAMEDVLAYIDDQRARFVQELTAWAKIPAISSDPARKADMLRNAEHLMAELRAIGMHEVQLWPNGAGGAGHPAVFAERTVSPDRPTLLVYGHHDVQPVDPLDQWTSPPFEPTVRDGRMWGRGVVDDKGQVHIHLKAIESFLRTRGELPVNLKLIVDAVGDNDETKAMHVWRSDQAVDDIYNAIFRELVTYMMEDPRNIGACTHLLFIAKNLERIGDHATNIAETVQYTVTGEALPERRPKGDTSAYADVRPRDAGE